MKEPSVVQLNFRCPESIIDIIDKDIEMTGEFRTRSEWILSAMRQFVDYRTKIIAERKAAFGSEEECDFTPSGSLQLRDEVKDRCFY
ncbi:hypothetical protein [Candidatus Methanoprimaticola sp. MG2]|uniref:hypothetical protein n=1 Tax=Candidatus Methanoprimaticola sp. MG2 TaxID=3228838 RepID=UPI0039C6BE21